MHMEQGWLTHYVVTVYNMYQFCCSSSADTFTMKYNSITRWHQAHLKGYSVGVNETFAENEVSVWQVGQRLQQYQCCYLCLEVTRVELVPVAQHKMVSVK